ncbi:MAG: UDP-2,4-diacetamido-2,4,6-trideoxy-beta-L-altropyranose hydrolase [Paraglaciecola sp.]|jgi:UDP-2,4-diacetamido-2,4,6-trideoxy-beta-L-altropyranose hydrolase
MHIAFRADSSNIIGHGHIMRCLTLAHALITQVSQNKQLKDINISFICRNHHHNINHLISQNKFTLITLPQGKAIIKQQDSNTWLGCSQEEDARQCITALKSLTTKIIPIDILVVDHYALDEQWHRLVSPYYQQLMAIDDLANRYLHCDLLLDQTLHRQSEHYLSHVSEHCQLLLGKDYMLLRDEFSILKDQVSIQRQLRSKQLTSANILISMGGGDPDNLSERALLAIAQLCEHYPNITVNLVLSSQSKYLKKLQQLSSSFSWCTLITDCKNMGDLMLSADIAIGASGATAWERCCLGLPSLITVNAENQQLIAKNLTDVGATINLGWHQEITIDTMANALEKLFNEPKTYLTMAENNLNCCDGLGASRVAKILIDRISTKQIKEVTVRSTNDE